MGDTGRPDKRENNFSRGRSRYKEINFSKSKSSKNNKGCFIYGKEGNWKRGCPDRGKFKGSSSVNVASAKN